ncbi:MAG: hypothetical protein IJS20_04175 [Bacteroidales bacterium]|nr:hypothetical protein [Bacteroidales bacterium]
MKRLLKKLLLLLLLLQPCLLLAQTDLSIGKVLDGRYKKNPHTTDVEIFSSRLVEYNLSYYHSLTVVEDSVIMDAVSQAVMTDEATAINKEVSFVGSRMYYGFLQMRREVPGENRYVFFRDMRVAPQGAQKPMVVLIFMEGAASLNDLKKKINK